MQTLEKPKNLFWILWRLDIMESKNSILIVDDDVTLLKMAGEILKHSYIVSCAKSGYEAISMLLSDYVPDIILLDVDMPNLDGFNTLKKLQQVESAKDIPVIFLTSVTHCDAELKGINYGAVDYITKPFVKDILIARIKVHLENGIRIRKLSILEKKSLNRSIDEDIFNRASKNLTDTEKNIFRLILLGYSNQEIAQELCYSHGYVKKVAGIIYNKNDVNKRNDLIKLFK